MPEPNRVALAYSGGLDTSAMIPWLRETYGCEVVAVVADVGQGDDLEAVRRKALRSGAAACEVADLRSEFVREFVFPALRAGAVYEGRYLLGTALARPLIARAQVRAARRHACDALAHGCTGKGNDQVRFELAYAALAPELPVVAPWREWELASRADAVAYARERDIPVPTSAERPYSVDRNLWHASYEGGILEDPSEAAPPGLFERTTDPEEAPAHPATVRVGFEAGLPTSVDGASVDPVALLQTLNGRAGAHGVGRVDLVENRVVGMKSRGAYETPGGTVLLAALRDLESITLDRETVRFKDSVSRRYADLVYEGKWFGPLREALDGFLVSACRPVTGEVTVRLYRGGCRPVARSAPTSLYHRGMATFGEDDVYDHADAEGFIRLWGLPTRVHAEVRKDGGSPTTGGRSTRPAPPDPPARTPEGEGGTTAHRDDGGSSAEPSAAGAGPGDALR
jgi:argininosuccinate synthase